MGRFPQYQIVSAEFWMSVAMTSQTESVGSNLVADKREITIQYCVCCVTRPVNILDFPQHSGVSTVEGFLLFDCQRPRLTSVKQDRLNCRNKEFLFELSTHVRLPYISHAV